MLRLSMRGDGPSNQWHSGNGRNAYTSFVAISATKTLLRGWAGPLTYIASAGAAGLVNAYSLSTVGSEVAPSIARDLDSVSFAFTSISLIAISMQFLYAREIGKGGKAPVLQGFFLSGILALSTFILSFYLIDSSTEFRFWTSLWIAIAGFCALIPSARLATLLINQKWWPICIAVVISALSRMLVWNISWFRAGISELIIGVIVSNFLPLLVLFYRSREQSLTLVPIIRIRQHVLALGILCGMGAVVGLASLSTKSNLGINAEGYSEIAQSGRKIFFLALIIAYSCFPNLCNYPLFSRDLSKHFRQAEFLAIGLCGASGFSFFAFESFYGQDNYSTSTPTLGIGLAAWTSISLAIVPLLYYVAHNSRLGLAVYVSAGMMMATQLVATTTLSLCLGLLVSGLFLLAVLCIPSFLRSRVMVGAVRPTADVEQLSAYKSLSVVVPSYNSGRQGTETVQSIYDALRNEVEYLQVIAVSDGSTDESCELFDSLDEPWFTHIRLNKNSGKGAALKTGFLIANSEVTAFIDADGDIAPQQLLKMYKTFIANEADVVFGSKWHPESKLQVSHLRRALSAVHHGIQVILFKLNLDDTQVGIKMYRTQALAEVLPVLKEEGFSLDLEIFIALSAYGHRRFIEVPVEIIRSGNSTISLSNVVTSFLDILRIFWRARVSLNYEARAYQTVQNNEEIKT